MMILKIAFYITILFGFLGFGFLPELDKIIAGAFIGGFVITGLVIIISLMMSLHNLLKKKECK